MRASKVAVDRVHAARVQPGAAQRPARRSRVSAAAAARATQASWPRAGACCARRAVGTSSRTPRLAAAAQPEDGARAAAAAEAGPDGAPAADVLLTEQLPCGELTVRFGRGAATARARHECGMAAWHADWLRTA